MTRKLLVLIPILAVALAVMWASPRDTKAQTFDPFFGPNDFYSLSDLSLNAHPDIRAQFNLLQPSANFSGLFGRAITFGDPAVSNANAAAIPGAGAYMGQLDAVSYLGLANEGCNTVVPVTFNFVEANTAVTSLPMTPAMTVNGTVPSGTTVTFTYTSTGDPIGPPAGASAGGQTKEEIEIGGERMLVTAINTTTNTITATRNWNGTPTGSGTGAINKMNVIYPQGPPANLLANMAEDDGDLDNSNIAAPEFPSMANNGVADGAEAIPSFIRDSFIASGNPATADMTHTPHARYFGVAFVANSLIVTLQFVIGNSGDLADYPNLDWADAAWGYSSSTFLQDPNAPPSNSAITDFCNFTSHTLLFGVPHDNQCTPNTNAAACTGAGAGFTLRLAQDNGCPASGSPPPAPNECGLAGQVNGICAASSCFRTTNPSSAQAVRFYQYSVSQRDYDADLTENALDTCSNIVNPGWDPRASNALSGGDTDGDGAPDPCDTAGGFQNDQDNDLWVNRLDNCPTIPNTVSPGGGGGTVPNTFQFDFDYPLGSVVPDGGPNSDSIGAACDIAGQSCATDGEGHACTTLTPTGANGRYRATAAATTLCIGGNTGDCSQADDDGDGVVNAQDTCRNGANPPFLYGLPGPQQQGGGVGATTLNATVGQPTFYSPAVTLTAAINNNPLTTTLTYTSTGDPIQTADQFIIDAERMNVTAVNTTTNTVTLQRAADTTLIAAHNAGVSILLTSLKVASTAGFYQGNPIVVFTPNETLRYITSINTNRININAFVSNTHVNTNAVRMVSYAQSLRDMNNDGFVDISDVNFLTNVFGFRGGDPTAPAGYQGRFDTNYDNFVDITDVSSLTGMFGAACGPQ